MSRIGKNPVPIPSGVDVQIAGNEVKVKGKTRPVVVYELLGIAASAPASSAP